MIQRLMTLAALSSVLAAPVHALETDDIQTLSTVFDQPGSLQGWQDHTVQGFSPKWQDPRIEDGVLVLEPTSSGWFEDMQAGHLYQQIEGNFIVTTRIQVEGTQAQLPQSGRFLAVANFGHFNPERPIEETTVDFWRVIEGAVPRLVQMDMSIPVMRGAHVAKVQP